jgi:serine/threonine protein phosphatase 1
VPARNYTRHLCVSDIHGCYHLLRELVEKLIRFDPETDRMTFLGDYIDLSPHSMKVVLYLQALKEKYPDNIVLLLGNHEDMAYEFLKQSRHDSFTSNAYTKLWLQNGGQATLNSFGSVKVAQRVLIPFIESLQPYLETNTHIFVHGGVPRNAKKLIDVPVYDLIWDRNHEYGGPKTLIVGHSPHPRVKKSGSIVCIDTGAYWYGKLSAYDVLNDVVYEVNKKTQDEKPSGNFSHNKKVSAGIK